MPRMLCQLRNGALDLGGCQQEGTKEGFQENRCSISLARRVCYPGKKILNSMNGGDQNLIC